MSDLGKRMRKNKIKMTPIQVQMLVDILYENSEIASGKLSARFPREERLKKWEAVATLLNSKDLGPQKTPDQWRKSWSDLKCATRSKAAKIELAGGTDLMNEKLSHLEKRVLQLSGDITLDNSEGSESKEKLTGELFLKKLEADLAKTEEDLLKAMKKPNQIVLPTTLSKILEERNRKLKQNPIVENVAAKDEADDQERDNSAELSSNSPVNPVVNSDDDDVDISLQDDGSNDDIVYDDSDVDEEAVDNPEPSYEPLSPTPKKRKVLSDDKTSSTTSSPKKRKVLSDDKTSSTISSGSKSFISVFQRQIETQTAVLKEQNSIMKDIAKSLRLIANSLHGS